MTLEQFLIENYSFTGATLLLGILILGSIVLVLILYIVNLKNKLTISKKPTYGFLGKSLYQFAALALVFGGMVFSVFYITSPRSGISVNDNLQDLTVDFNYNVLQKGKNYYVEFDTVPVLNDEHWGTKVTNNFDIFVNIVGSESYSEIMYQRNADTGAKFTKIIPPGEYKIEITVVYKDTVRRITKTITLED